MSHDNITTATLGVPRIGRRRELKFALESYWSGKSSEDALLQIAKELRANNWQAQQALGITTIPSNEFSLYDHVLDTAVMVGAIPERYGWTGGQVPLKTYFAMARGQQDQGAETDCRHSGASAMEMTKWFDTNYHYMVPELSADQAFKLSSSKPIDEFLEAKALEIQTRPVILGPVTFLKLSKASGAAFEPLTLLPALLPVYEQLLQGLAVAGADWVQIDEPCLVLDLSEADRKALASVYSRFSTAVPGLKIMLATYFGALNDNLACALNLPVAGLHVDLVRAPKQLQRIVAEARQDLVLSLGVIDGRNVWRTDLAAVQKWLRPVVTARSHERIELAPSCSLLHVPIDLEQETDLDPELKSWLAFANQKMEELSLLGRVLGEDDQAAASLLKQSTQTIAARAASPKVNALQVQRRVSEIDATMLRRNSSFARREPLQRERLHLPDFPTTTIGSFPQTADVRKSRAAHAKGALNKADYEAFVKQETEAAIRWQEDVGLDVLVHGEFERNDMVQYFGEQLSGFAFTKHAWVQSYGSRYVRPPIIYGDVARPRPMTVAWWQYAQSLTDKPVKGMLTGPVTILNWSFVRDDLPRADVCRQIALAIRDEVNDLEQAGAAIIQIDEAALREGLPLRKSEWQTYLDWAVECFRLTSSGVKDATQIHTHMCYSEFNDIIDAIAAMDADVISIETSRSRMELLGAFQDYKYPNEIGPGVYDIHSPRIPPVDEIVDLLSHARKRLSDKQLWVNPDCGLKTRKWDEVRPAIAHMVQAAKSLRSNA